MTHPLEVTLAAWLAQEEAKRQENVILARNYYAGDHKVPLTERQKAFLGFNAPDSRFALNYCAIVVNAVAERMIVERFSTDTNDEALEEWAKDLWRENRMDQHQQDTHRKAVCDAEHFVIVDWDEEAERPRLSPHPRYTDPTVKGDGFGCKAHYPDDDPTQPMKYASKRWTETTWDGPKRVTMRHLNLYYPDRVEWYALAGGGETTDWVLDHIEPWTVGGTTPGAYNSDGMWVPNETAEPRGIPVFHFLNTDEQSELWDAIPIQDAINKTALDILGAADSAGFPILIMRGGHATTDGKEPESDGSNYLKFHPGMILSGIDPAGGVERLPPADLMPMLNTLDSLIFKLAQVTGTPMTRFMTSRQIAAEGTLKQQEEPLLAKIRSKQTTFGNAWEDAMSMARKLDNEFGGKGLDEEVLFETEWVPAQTRDEMADDKAFWEAAGAARQAGCPLPVWLELQGWDEAAIAKVVESEEYKERQAMTHMNLEMARGAPNA